MTKVIQSNNPVGGGFKIAPLRGLTLDDYRLLTRYQEYLSNEYCISCTYFESTKGHLGMCLDLPHRKPFDGTKKNSACALWRKKSIYGKYSVEQTLPEKPFIRPLRVIPLNSIHHRWVFLPNAKCPRCKKYRAFHQKWRKNKRGTVNVVRCAICGKCFTICNLYIRSKQFPEVDEYILNLARLGNSSRTISAKVLLKYGDKISHNAVINKIHRFAPEIQLHQGIQPNNENYESWKQKERLATLNYYAKIRKISARAKENNLSLFVNKIWVH